MSLPRLAVRVASVAALRGRTLAGDAVHDSAIQTVDVLAAGARHPFVVVYTDDGEAQPSQADPASGQASFSLIIEFAVAALRRPEEGGDPELLIPPADAALEVDLDRMERQILVALRDPANAWGVLWRRFVTEITVRRSRRGASAERGLRFAARQIEMQVRSLAEPPFGAPAAGVWTDFLAALAADPSTAPLEPLVRAEIEGEGSGTLAIHIRRRFASADLEAMGYDPSEETTTLGPVSRIEYDHPVYGDDDA